MDVDFGNGSEGTGNSVSSEQISEDDDSQAQLLVFYPNRQPVPYKLYDGANIVGRQSSFAQRDANRLHSWSIEYSATSVHGIFLESSSVSSAHALISIEDQGSTCYVQDLKSRNKTFVKDGGRHTPLDPEARALVEDECSLTFGALKCRILLTAGRNEDLANRKSAANRTILTVPSSRAVSIGQRTVSSLNLAGRPTFLDKCPSLQEWFQHPAKISPRDPGHADAAILNPLSEEDRGELPHRHSFGFGQVEQDDCTSSDCEPETPRIDRPTIRAPHPKSPASPFLSDRPQSAAMAEDEHETAPPSDQKNADPVASADVLSGGKEESLSMEMGAEALTQLRSRSPSPAPRPRRHSIDVPQSFAPTPESRAQSLHNDELELTRGRPLRVRKKSPQMKRSRSGSSRVISPEKSQPRSKSPRLQQPGSSNSEVNLRNPSSSLEEITDAVRDLLPS